MMFRQNSSEVPFGPSNRWLSATANSLWEGFVPTFPRLRFSTLTTIAPSSPHSGTLFRCGKFFAKAAQSHANGARPPKRNRSKPNNEQQPTEPTGTVPLEMGKQRSALAQHHKALAKQAETPSSPFGEQSESERNAQRAFLSFGHAPVNQRAGFWRVQMGRERAPGGLCPSSALGTAAVPPESRAASGRLK